MRAVWSFWSAPYRSHYHANWRSQRRHLLAWTLSVCEATRHYPEAWLYTDEAGARLLVDGLRLPFRQVDVRLERLSAARPDDSWWVLGKLETYAAQETPFIHLDSDVFLWRPLPARAETSAVFAQNPETFQFTDQSLYRIDAFMNGVARFDGWLPDEWRSYAAKRGAGAVCCGILGGRDAGFIRHYAQQAMAVIRHPANQPIWPTLGVRDNILVEQYFLAACLAHHGSDPDSPFAGVGAGYLFESSIEAFDAAASTRAGFTHLIGDAKSDAEVGARLERRVRADYPDYYERCCELEGWMDTARVA
jgi:hypothetical protein